MANNDGGPAFSGVRWCEKHESGLPYEDSDAFTRVPISYDGMSLRDYFAGQALIGRCASDPMRLAMDEHEADLVFVNAAAFAYRMADAMLAEREK